ncbi:hypothetical protein RJZ57_004081 [Blastomyces gilchristii]
MSTFSVLQDPRFRTGLPASLSVSSTGLISSPNALYMNSGMVGIPRRPICPDQSSTDAGTGS